MARKASTRRSSRSYRNRDEHGDFFKTGGRGTRRAALGEVGASRHRDQLPHLHDSPAAFGHHGEGVRGRAGGFLGRHHAPDGFRRAAAHAHSGGDRHGNQRRDGYADGLRARPLQVSGARAVERADRHAFRDPDAGDGRHAGGALRAAAHARGVAQLARRPGHLLHAGHSAGATRGDLPVRHTHGPARVDGGRAGPGGGRLHARRVEVEDVPPRRAARDNARHHHRVAAQFRPRAGRVRLDSRSRGQHTGPDAHGARVRLRADRILQPARGQLHVDTAARALVHPDTASRVDAEPEPERLCLKLKPKDCRAAATSRAARPPRPGARVWSNGC